MTAYLLALLALALAWPIPLWLQHAAWPSRAPGPALVLWQAIGLAGGMALVTAPLSWGLQPFGTGLGSATVELWRVAHDQGLPAVLQDARWHPLGFAAITLGLVLFGHLSLMLLHTAYQTIRQRRRHRDFVALLSASLQEHTAAASPQTGSAAQTRVLPVEQPLAYCVPGTGRPITVISQGLLEEFSADQVAAILAHEQAHLIQRHDLLRLAFHAWQKAVPWFPATGVAAREVMELTEILADEAALANHPPAQLIAAIARLAQVPHPGVPTPTALPAHHAAAPRSRRVRRLGRPEPALGAAGVSLVVLTAGLLVAIPAVISLV